MTEQAKTAGAGSPPHYVYDNSYRSHVAWKVAELAALGALARWPIDYSEEELDSFYAIADEILALGRLHR